MARSQFQSDLFEATPLVKARAHRMCERCGISPLMAIHHKRGRIGPNVNDLENLMGVCDACHSYIHANPSESYEKGWMIRRVT